MPIRCARPLGGGCIASAWRLETTGGLKIFAKTVEGPSPFPAEALGLEHLRVSGGVRVPEVLWAGEEALLLEWIDFGSPCSGFQEKFGEQLATTHGRTESSFGFDLDHRIGSTPQQNLPRIPDTPGAWAEFWWSHRLQPMIRRLQPDTARNFYALEPRVIKILGENSGPPRVLHGDLWSGNAGAGPTGEPVMFDPAVYYGHPEADLAMTRMFGGFSPGFYEAYRSVQPLENGWSDRLDFYMLYHVLNHVVIFGASYLAQANALLKRFL